MRVLAEPLTRHTVEAFSMSRCRHGREVIEHEAVGNVGARIGVMCTGGSRGDRSMNGVPAKVIQLLRELQ